LVVEFHFEINVNKGDIHNRIYCEKIQSMLKKKDKILFKRKIEMSTTFNKRSSKIYKKSQMFLYAKMPSWNDPKRSFPERRAHKKSEQPVSPRKILLFMFRETLHNDYLLRAEQYSLLEARA